MYSSMNKSILKSKYQNSSGKSVLYLFYHVLLILMQNDQWNKLFSVIYVILKTTCMETLLYSVAMQYVLNKTC